MNAPQALRPHDTTPQTPPQSLRWPLILGLGLAGLARPVTNIVLDRTGADLGAVVPLTWTLLISLLWIAVVGLTRTARPVLTLVLTGLTYAVGAILLSGVLSPLLLGHLAGPLAHPIARAHAAHQRRVGRAHRRARPAAATGAWGAHRGEHWGAGMRHVGMALLGLLGGLLAGVVLQDVLAPLLVRGGEVTTLGLVLLPLLLPLSALAGAALAVALSLTRTRRDPDGPSRRRPGDSSTR